MAIEFACVHCQQYVRVGDAAAGKKGKCPHCGTVVQIPGPSGGPQTAAASAPAAATPPKKNNNVSFPCPSCAKTVTAPAAMAGKRGKCPHCQSLLIIGGGAVPAASTPASRPLAGLTPLSPQGELTPLDNGLTPLRSELTPLGGGPMPLGGLTPLGGGLAPLGNALDDLPALSPMPGFAPAPLTPAPAFAAGNPLGVPAGGYLPAANLGAYAAPSQRGSSGSTAPPKLMVPAIAMISISAITLAWLLYQLAMLLLTPFVLPVRLEMELLQNPAQREAYVAAFYGIQLVIMGIVALVNASVLFGAVQMIRMRGLGSAKTAAVLGLMPCSLCCLNFPFAIWALIVLGQNDVWRRFQA